MAAAQIDLTALERAAFDHVLQRLCAEIAWHQQLLNQLQATGNEAAPHPFTMAGLFDRTDVVINAIRPRNGRAPNGIQSIDTATVTEQMRRANAGRLISLGAAGR